MGDRIDLGDGQWADLRPWLTHGEKKRVQRAWLAVANDLENSPDVDTALVAAYVEAWHVIGRDGQPVPVERIEDAPADALDRLVPILSEKWKGRADPNAIGSSSSSSPLEPASTSETISSPT